MKRAFGLALVGGAATVLLVGLFTAHDVGADFESIFGGAICVGIALAGIGFGCLLVVTVFQEFTEAYGKMLRRAVKHPRFSLLTLMEFTAVFAVTFSILQWSGMLGGRHPLELFLQSIVSFVLAIGAVAMVDLVIGDVRELFVRRNKPSGSIPSDPWDTPKKKEIHLPGLEDDPIEPGDAGQD